MATPANIRVWPLSALGQAPRAFWRGRHRSGRRGGECCIAASRYAEGRVKGNAMPLPAVCRFEALLPWQESARRAGGRAWWWGQAQRQLFQEDAR